MPKAGADEGYISATREDRTIIVVMQTPSSPVRRPEDILVDGRLTAQTGRQTLRHR